MSRKTWTGCWPPSKATPASPGDEAGCGCRGVGSAGSGYDDRFCGSLRTSYPCRPHSPSNITETWSHRINRLRRRFWSTTSMESGTSETTPSGHPARSPQCIRSQSSNRRVRSAIHGKTGGARFFYTANSFAGAGADQVGEMRVLVGGGVQPERTFFRLSIVRQPWGIVARQPSKHVDDDRTCPGVRCSTSCPGL